MTSPKILALGAHPDDLEFGLGGVLLTERAAGAEITLAITSRGESASYGTPVQRESEARAAADLLGATLTILEFEGDGAQSAAPANGAIIARLIREVRPTLVFAPISLANQHPDHVAVSHATRDACRLARFAGFAALADLPPHTIDSLWFYAITPPGDASLAHAILVDISASTDRWKDLMACHASQLAHRDYLDLQLTRARQLGLLAGCESATALWPNDPPVVSTLAPLSRTARAF